jgi:hypothetical protein
MNLIAFFINVAALLFAGWPEEIQGTPAVKLIAFPFILMNALAQQAPRNRETNHLPAAVTVLAGTIMVRYGAGLGIGTGVQIFTMAAFWIVAACQNFNQREAR